ncbi:MAG: hypothetical protein Q7O66_12080, partial [Dehalococcoidia bacterium]|nr:hypothetical protein [Dehalococcoidia bacterium]
VEGVRWMIHHGIFPHFHAIWLGTGSTYGDDPSSPSKIAPTEFYLDAGLANHQACMETDFYKTFDKLLLCPLDCADALYSGEIGMIELAGDLGKWIADAIPEDANWLARFIASLKATQSATDAK